MTEASETAWLKASPNSQWMTKGAAYYLKPAGCLELKENKYHALNDG